MGQWHWGEEENKAKELEEKAKELEEENKAKELEEKAKELEEKNKTKELKEKTNLWRLFFIHIVIWPSEKN
jgi:uncharacterized membrane protein